jgi:hypothetical protein
MRGRQVKSRHNDGVSEVGTQLGRMHPGSAFARIPLLVGFVSAVSLVYAPQPAIAALAQVPTFTWTGHDAALAGCSNPNDPRLRWSDPNNWKGAIAPSSNSAIDLVFPNISGCGDSIDDLSSLIVRNMTITGSSYQISTSTDDGITLDELSVPSGGFATIDLPVTLGQRQRWEIGGTVLFLDSQISGSNALSVDMSSPSSYTSFQGGSISTGRLVFKGPSGIVPRKPTVFLDLPSVNTAGAPIDLVNVGESFSPDSLTDTSVGPLSIKNSILAIPHDTSVTSSGDLQLAGGQVNWENAGSNGLLPGVYVTPGTVSLKNIQMGFDLWCATPTGTTFTLMRAAKGIRGHLMQGDSELLSGGTFHVGSCSTSANGITPSPINLRIDYTATSLTATVIAS